MFGRQRSFETAFKRGDQNETIIIQQKILILL